MNIEGRPRDQYVFVFSDCIPVKGAAISAIYDLTRGRISTFQSEYYPFFDVFGQCRLGEILDTMCGDERANFVDFLSFLLDNDYACMMNSPHAFPKISSSWDSPCVVLDAIIDVDKVDHDYGKIISDLDVLGCQHLQIRSYSGRFGTAELVRLARQCHGTSIQTLQAILLYDPRRTDDDYAAVVRGNRIVVSVVVHSANEDRQFIVDYGANGNTDMSTEVEICYTAKAMDSHLDCGTITMRDLLVPSTSTFNEIRHFNGCLNRKISVDASGHVRNCPAMEKSFGHYADVSLTKVAVRSDFQDAWRVRKDEIQICQDCPYRYACTDCRAFVDEPDAKNSKPLKCGYDPYSDTWADWTTQAKAVAAMEKYRKRHLPIVAP